MSQIFDGYEREFNDYASSISRQTALVPSLSGDEKKEKIVSVETDISEAEALIRRMDLEARSIQSPATKTPLLAKLRDFKSELQRLKRDVKNAAAAASSQSQREQLLAGAELSDSYAPTSSSQRERLLQATERVNRTGDRIRDGKKQLLETEELGVSILQDLHKQRETILHARETVHGADDNIGKSRRILAAMGRRAMANKIVMYGIILMLLGAIGVIVYFKMIKK